MGALFNGPPRDIFRGFSIPPIHDVSETASMLAETVRSFSRFGDGEFKLMTETGVDHSFQRGSEELSRRLREIVGSDEASVEIGVNRIYYYSDGFDHPYIENFIFRRGYGSLMTGRRYPDLLTRGHYYDSVFSIPFHHYALPRDFFEGYYAGAKRIWEGRVVWLVTGDVEIAGYAFNIFSESARDVKVVGISKTDAFEYHGRILKHLKGLGISKKNDIVLLVCGIEGTVLAYDLAELGYRAIDAGHIAKEYDMFRRGVVPYSRADKGFF